MKNWGFRSIVSLITLSGVLAAAIAINIVCFGMLYQEKMTDTWAILYLEMERKSTMLSRYIRREVTEVKTLISRQDLRPYLRQLKEQESALKAVMIPQKGGTFEFVYNPLFFSSGDPLIGRLGKLQTDSVIFGKIGGKTLMGAFLRSKSDGILYLTLTEIDFLRWFDGVGASDSHATIYLMNRNSDLLYSNVNWLSESEARVRPVVQKFIHSPLGQSLSGFKNASDLLFYGFYYQIPGSNLAIFSELDLEIALKPVKKVLYKSLAICLGIIALIILMIQFPLTKVLSPLRKLTLLTRSVSEGVFNVRFIPSGVGEFRFLGESFVYMCRNLYKKDEAIKQYIKEVGVKVRMEHELEIAKQVQNNLLIKHEIPPQTGMDVATDYRPASEVAGDWYGTFHDENEGCTIIAVADVSGHGAGSSMFTAIIAAAFDKFIDTQNKSEALPIMLTELNSRIFRLGKSGLHSTMVMAYIKDHQVTWYNAGHNFPLLINAQKNSVKSLILPSSPLGIEAEFKVCSAKFELKENHFLFFYTDGLIENKDPDGKMFGKKKLLKFFKTVSPDDTAAQTLVRLNREQSNFAGDQIPDDDTCLLILKRRL